MRLGNQGTPEAPMYVLAAWGFGTLLVVYAHNQYVPLLHTNGVMRIPITTRVSLQQIRWILKILHDAKRPKRWELFYYSILRSCKSFGTSRCIPPYPSPKP